MTRIHHLWIVLIIGIALLGASSAYGQDNVNVTIFRSPDSVTVYLPAVQPVVNLVGFRFQTVTIAGTTIDQTLETLPAFLGLPYSTIPTPICFHITRSVAPVAPPLECQSITTLIQSLVDANVFWYDLSSHQDRTLTIMLGELPRICPAGSVRCDLSYPLPTPIPSDTSNPTTEASVDPFTPVERNEDWTPIIKTFDGVEMVLVPAGCFMMGSANGAEDEKPVSEICFDAPFWIDRYEVTNEQFNRFDGRAGRESYWIEANRPREQINWFEARDFCERRSMHLPTEAEWEYAARGPSAWLYPWGDEFVTDYVVYKENADETADVESVQSGASWVGAQHMSGNVWEWVNTIYGIDGNGDREFNDSSDQIYSYPYTEDDGREQNSNDVKAIRIVRGGSWDDGFPESTRATFRGFFEPLFELRLIGFRCARDYVEGDFVP